MKGLRLLTVLVCALFHGYAVDAQIKFEKHTIATISTPRDVFICDVNLDGNSDILIVDADNNGEIRLYRNTGNKSFLSSAIATNIQTPRSVRAGDIDLDGDIDIIAAVFEADKISWWENDGELNFTRHDIDTDFDGAHTVELCDLDSDGDIDVLCCEFDNTAAMSEVAWWENDGHQNWTKHIVSSRFQQSTFVIGADMDNDGDNDLIACGELNGEVVMWKNDGSQNWTELIIDNQFPKAHTIVSRDFDKDGDLDILAHACTSGKQAWYKNDGNGNFQKIEMEDLPGAIWLDQGDFDSDGDNDLIGTGMGATQLVCYENTGSQKLNKQWVDGGISSGFALNVADMDGDRDPDVVAIGYNSNSLSWWENVSSPVTVYNESRTILKNPDTGNYFIANETGSIGVVEDSGWNCIINNNFPICSGLAFLNGNLLTNAGVEIVILDPESGIRKDGIRVPAQFLMGLDLSPDGIVFVSDPYSGAILKVDPQSHESEVLSADLVFPQSIFYDKYFNRLIVLDGEQDVNVVVINPESGAKESSIETTIPAGGYIVGDGNGNYYVSSPQEGRIYAATDDMTTEFFVFADDLSEPYGLLIDTLEKKLIILEAGKPGISEIEANATKVDLLPNADREFTVFPNPVSDILTLVNIPDKYEGGLLQLYSSDGKLIVSKEIQSLLFSQTIKLNLAAILPELSQGLYQLILTNRGERESLSVLVN